MGLKKRLFLNKTTGKEEGKRFRKKNLKYFAVSLFTKEEAFFHVSVLCLSIIDALSPLIKLKFLFIGFLFKMVNTALAVIFTINVLLNNAIQYIQKHMLNNPNSALIALQLCLLV